MNQITVADYVDWAVGMILCEKDSANLRMLAGLDPTVSLREAELHFARALQELKIVEPDRSAKFRAYIAEVAQQILDETLSPRAGARLLYEVCELLDSIEAS